MRTLSRHRLPVNVLAVPDRSDFDDASAIVDLIDDPKRADAEPPEVGRAAQLAAPCRPRVTLQVLEAPEDATQHRVIETLKFPPC